MENNKDWVSQEFLYYHADDFPQKTTHLTYFALTDALIHHAAKINKPILYAWPTEKVIFLGMIDTKLPHLEKGMKVLEDAGYDAIVRNSGGLAVVSDPGVLNFSIIFPEEDHMRLNINDAYERMHYIIAEALKSYNVEVIAKEIPDSYCPGDYDLSINGRKIAGISQRRIKGGLAIMIYVGIDGVQDDRSLLIKEFYEKGLQGEEVKWHYPDINPDVMVTVSDEIDGSLSVNQVIKHLIDFFASVGSITPGDYTEEMLAEYQTSYDKMVDRNHRMLKDLFDKEAY